MLASLALLFAAACPAPPPVAADDPATLKRHEGPMAKVLEAAKESGRPVLLDFFTDW